MTGKEEKTERILNKILKLENSKLTSQGEIKIEFVKMKKRPITERLDQANEPHQWLSDTSMISWRLQNQSTKN